MLKYVSKFAMDILPSVVATIIGAYIVNHYIAAKPAADAPVAAAVSSAEPEEGRCQGRCQGRRDRPPTSASIPEPGVKAKGISEKAMLEKIGRRKAAGDEKPVEKAADKPAETASIPAEPAAASAAAARKGGRQDRSGAGADAGCVAPVVAAPNPAPPVEAAVAPEEHRDANDLARAAIERLRGAGDGSPRAQEAARAGSAASRRRAVVSSAARGRRRRFGRCRRRSWSPRLPARRSIRRPDRRETALRGRRAIDDPRRPTPPADIPTAPPLDLRAEAAEPPPREHTTSPKTCCRRRNRCFTRCCRNSLAGSQPRTYRSSGRACRRRAQSRFAPPRPWGEG